MLKPKKIPMRQCKGCREMFPKRELLRVVRSPVECFQKARKARSLERELECAISDEVYDQLKAQLIEAQV